MGRLPDAGSSDQELLFSAAFPSLWCNSVPPSQRATAWRASPTLWSC